MKVYRNGVEVTDLDWNDGQLLGISLSMAAMDAEIGMGTMPVPGDPGWVAGDRITVTEQGLIDEWIIYTGFVGDRHRYRNPRAPLELETSVQLMDVNRQWIGRAVIDYQPGGDFDTVDSIDVVNGFLGAYMADLTLDTSDVDSGSPVTMLNPFYTSDGFMDMLANVILYTGWTAFLTHTQTENEYAVHYHSLTTGSTSLLEIDDTPGSYDGLTVFAPQGPQVSYNATDLKNDITGRNQKDTVPGTNSGSITAHDAGGLKWQAVLNYSTDQNGLVLYVNSLLQSAGDEKPTYSCTIGPLDGDQLSVLNVGDLIRTTSVVMGLTSQTPRISHMTLSVARDSQGNAAPGLWDAQLELSYPRRLPTAALGYGGQGGSAGALADPFLLIDHLGVTPNFIPIGGFPVGDSTSVVVQLETVKNDAVALLGITITLTLVMWADIAHTVPGDGWSLADSSLDTDKVGRVSTVLTRDTTGTAIEVWVEANL